MSRTRAIAGAAVRRRPEPPPRLRADHPDWRRLAEGLNAAVDHIGRARFPSVLLDRLNAFVRIDHLTVFEVDLACEPRISHVASAGRLRAETVERLAAAYTTVFGPRDPNVRRLAGGARTLVGGLIAKPSRRAYDRDYHDQFFARTRLIDKVSLIAASARSFYYCNFYRMDDTGAFEAAEREALGVLAPVASALIVRHALEGKIDEIDLRPDLETRVRSVVLDGVGPFAALAASERLVCARIILGDPIADIASRLGVAHSTVVTYRRRAYAKLDLSSKDDLFRAFIDAA